MDFLQNTGFKESNNMTIKKDLGVTINFYEK